MCRAKSTLLQCPDCFQTSQHSYYTVVFPCVRNGVDMRSSADHGCGLVQTIPTGEGISNSILADGESCLLASRFHPCASFEIRGRENNSSHRWRLGVRKRSQSLNFRQQPLSVDS